MRTYPTGQLRRGLRSIPQASAFIPVPPTNLILYVEVEPDGLHVDFEFPDTPPETEIAYSYVEVSEDGIWSGILVELEPGTAGYSFTGQVGSAYMVRIKRCSPAGCSAFATSNTVIIGPETIVLSLENSDITGDWSDPVNADSQELEQKFNAGEWTTLIPDGMNNSLAMNDNPDGFYTWRVRFCNAFGCSAWVESNTVEVVS